MYDMTYKIHTAYTRLTLDDYSITSPVIVDNITKITIILLTRH